MVDWELRIFQELPDWLGADLFVEIGCDYAQFFAQLVRWTGRFETARLAIRKEPLQYTKSTRRYLRLRESEKSI